MLQFHFVSLTHLVAFTSRGRQDYACRCVCRPHPHTGSRHTHPAAKAWCPSYSTLGGGRVWWFGEQWVVKTQPEMVPALAIGLLSKRDCPCLLI